MRTLLTFIALLVAWPAAGWAQIPGELPVQWEAMALPEILVPGEEVHVTVTGTIDPGWRVYAMDSPVGRPLAVRYDVPDVLVPQGPARQGEPREGFDQTLEMDYTYFAEEVQVVRSFVVADDTANGEAVVEGGVTFMVCNDEICYPPRTEPFAVTVQIAGAEVADAGGTEAREAGAPEPVAARPAEPPAENEEPAVEAPAADTDVAAAPAVAPERRAEVETMPVAPAKPDEGGLWAFLLLAAGAGLAALLAPCVFPMIPLTVSYFLHHGGDRKKAVRLAGVYGLSIIGIFTGLGLAMALVVGAAGPQLIAANPWVNLFIGLVLVVFGFSLLGFYELRLPAGLLNYFNRQGNERGGYAGVLFMGLTLTLVSFSCTVPFVGGLLAAAVQNDWGRPILGMVVFSAVFAFPFVLFALFPNALGRLPKSGSWMGALKGVLGFVEVAAALKFFSNADLVWGLGVLPRPLAVALMVVLFTLTGLYLLGKLPLATPEAEAGGVALPAPIGALRLLTAVGFFGLALYLVPGLLGAPLGAIDAFLPPQRVTDVSLLAMRSGGTSPEQEEGWYQTREAAFAEAERTGRPVLIDFTGYTCTNCRYMEANVLSKPAIAERIEGRFVPLQLWTDDGKEGPELQRYQLQLTGRLALPTYAIVTPEGTLVEQLSGVVPLERFAQFLDGGLARLETEDRLALRQPLSPDDFGG